MDQNVTAGGVVGQTPNDKAPIVEAFDATEMGWLRVGGERNVWEMPGGELRVFPPGVVPTIQRITTPFATLPWRPAPKG